MRYIRAYCEENSLKYYENAVIDLYDSMRRAQGSRSRLTCLWFPHCAGFGRVFNGVTDKTPPEAETHTHQPDDEDLEAEPVERAAIENEPEADLTAIPPMFERRTSRLVNGST
jgi:hypothetical protein